MILQNIELIKFAIIVSDELLSPEQWFRTELIKAICQKIREEKHEFTCKVNKIVYLSSLSTNSWIKIFNMHFHYVLLKDTYLFFPNQTNSLALTDNDKIEFVALQIL